MSGFKALRCTACGLGGTIHLCPRFPTVQLCWDCIKKAQRVLYAVNGNAVPRLPWLVVEDGLWLYESNAATNYPFPRDP